MFEVGVPESPFPSLSTKNCLRPTEITCWEGCFRLDALHVFILSPMIKLIRELLKVALVLDACLVACYHACVGGTSVREDVQRLHRRVPVAV